MVWAPPGAAWHEVMLKVPRRAPFARSREVSVCVEVRSVNIHAIDAKHRAPEG